MTVTTPPPQPSPEAPTYRKVLENPTQPTPLFMIVCDEGWRESIVCQALYEWAADWLLEVLGRRPYAPQQRPGAATPDERRR